MDGEDGHNVLGKDGGVSKMQNHEDWKSSGKPKPQTGVVEQYAQLWLEGVINYNNKVTVTSPIQWFSACQSMKLLAGVAFHEMG